VIVTCPGCRETYETDLDGVIVVVDFAPFGVDRQEPIMLERFTAPDGTEYCCDNCFIENGEVRG
jgi:hypothetical protein